MVVDTAGSSGTKEKKEGLLRAKEKDHEYLLNGHFPIGLHFNTKNLRICWMWRRNLMKHSNGNIVRKY